MSSLSTTEKQFVVIVTQKLRNKGRKFFSDFEARARTLLWKEKKRTHLYLSLTADLTLLEGL